MLFVKLFILVLPCLIVSLELEHGIGSDVKIAEHDFVRVETDIISDFNRKKKPVKKPGKKPGKKPEKKPSKKPTSGSSGSGSGTSKKPPKKTGKKAGKKTGKKTGKKAGKKPTKKPSSITSGNGSGISSGTTPSKKPTKKPGKKPAKKPEKTSGKKPAKKPGKKPAKVTTPKPSSKAPGNTTTPSTVATSTFTDAPTTPPCQNCTASNGKTCVFPFSYGDGTFTSCTSWYTNGGAPWCSTKVDQYGIHISGAGEYGNCPQDCPSDVNTDAVPACQTASPSILANITPTEYPENCAARHQSTNKKVLFLGNSYTYYNDLPGMLKGMASAAGMSLTTSSNTPGGQTLGGHASGSLGSISSDKWDVVVMQGQSQRPSMPPGYVLHGIVPETRTLVNAIRANDPCTIPMFFLTWGKRDGDSQNCAGYTKLCTFEGVQERLTESYTTFAYLNQPASVAPVGPAWQDYPSRNSLFTSDGSHPSKAGSYLAACVFFESIFGVSSVGNGYQPVSNSLELQELAHKTINDGQWSWPQPNYKPCAHCIG